MLRLPGLPGARPSDDHGKHLAIFDSETLQGLAVIPERLPVQIEMLGVGRQIRLTLNRAFQIRNGKVRWQVKREEVGILGFIGSID